MVTLLRSMSMFFKLPKDITLSVISQWLSFPEIVKLDSSVRSHVNRTLLLEYLSSDEFILHRVIHGCIFSAWVWRRNVAIEAVNMCQDTEHIDVRFAEYLRRKGVKIKFIEFMPALIYYRGGCPTTTTKHKDHFLLSNSWSFENVEEVVNLDAGSTYAFMHALRTRCPKIKKLCLHEISSVHYKMSSQDAIKGFFDDVFDACNNPVPLALEHFELSTVLWEPGLLCDSLLLVCFALQSALI